MSNLTTRKIVLGLLMVLVLAFSVQGIADALTFGTSRSGDLATESPTPNDFDIRFSVSLKGNTTPIRDNGELVSDNGTRIDSSGYPVFDASDGNAYRTTSTTVGNLESDGGNAVTGARPTYDETPQATNESGTLYVDNSGRVVNAAGVAVYIRTGTGTKFNDNNTPGDTTDDTAADRYIYTRATANPNAKVDDANRFHYNQEQVTIAVTGADITHVGRYDITNKASHSLMETGKEGTLLSSSITLTLEADAAAVVTITISDTTPEDDLPNGIARAPAITFTVYVVGPLNAAGTTTVASATDGVERVSDQSDTRINGHFTFNPAGNEPVNYSVEGSGRLYVSLASDRKTTPTNNLYTSSSAPVYLDTSGGSSKVTAYIAGSSETAIVLYLFSGGTLSTLPKIEVQSGSPQTGAPSGRLDYYFEVKVTDGRRRPVSGVPVMFTKSDPSIPSSPTTPSMFIPVPDTRIYADAPDEESIDAEVPDITIAEDTSTFPATSRNSVQTDRNGVAKIYYQLSSNSGAHTVTAAAYGIGLSATLNATASTSSRARIANLEIVSGNPQSAAKGKDLDKPLVVIVRSLAGHRVQDVIVQFRTTTGTLVPSETTTQPDTVLEQGRGTVLHPLSGQQIYVETGPNGEAGVTYNVGQLVEARDVIAEIREEAQEETQYDFAIDRVVFNVNGRAGTSQPSQPSQPAAAARTITLTLSSTTGEPGDEIDVTVTSSSSGDFVVIDDGDFSASDFDDLSGLTPHETTLTLPDEEGEYDFFAVGPGGVTSNEVTVTVENRNTRRGFRYRKSVLRRMDSKALALPCEIQMARMQRFFER